MNVVGKHSPSTPLLREISQQIQRFILLPDPSLYEFIALWAIGTHLYKEFQHYGILNLESNTHECGKSTTMEILQFLCCNADSPTIAPTQAGLFHGANNVTMLLDEVDMWPRDLYQSLVSILNAGFGAGGVVTRLAKDERGNYDE